MGTAGKMARAQAAVNTAGTLAEAQTALALVMEAEQDVTDVFWTQEQMIESLQDILDLQDNNQPVYMSAPAPRPQPKNYALYLAIGIGLLFFSGAFKKFVRI